MMMAGDCARRLPPEIERHVLSFCSLKVLSQAALCSRDIYMDCRELIDERLKDLFNTSIIFVFEGHEPGQRAVAPFHTAHYEKTEQLRTDNGDSAYATFRIQMFRTMDCAALYRVKVDEEIFTQLSLRGSIVRESRRRKGFLESAVLCFEHHIRLRREWLDVPCENHLVYLDAQKSLAVEIAVVQSRVVSSGTLCSVECVLQFCKLYIRQGYLLAALEKFDSYAENTTAFMWQPLTRSNRG